ncbi:SDR family oxidoreductase [Leucobacter aridicollis]|uniref:SDR family oxidoreductase n=1 Tax=Leucobacter aridicollis TaxID=283878 RepID=UPI002107375A|nr:NmrA family NAD(P)-binding protein [Leucobacter aridicollis]UTX54476.1 NmrA family NAD(P)-binding protein [Leucobacter aridicollis]
MTTVIHGATGAQGSPVVAALAALGEQPIALSRGGKQVDGARALAVDATSATDLAAVYADAEAVFVHLPMAPEDERLRIAHATIAALESARPGRVVISTSGSIVSAPGTPLQAPSDSSLAVLIAGATATGIPTAVVEPRLFLENLLLPHVQAGVREEGVLRYPVRPDFAVSWASHMDVAAAVAALLRDPSVTGVVRVGHVPAVTGPELAAAFGAALGSEVRFEPVTPAAFGASIAPLLGEGAAAGVAGLYTALGAEADFTFDPATSAEARIGVAPMPLATWAQAVTAS